MRNKLKGRINPELKEKILESIKNDWLSVSQASREYKVSSNTIHYWLRQELTTNSSWEKVNSSSLKEIRRLKKDKEDLLIIIWALSVEVEKLKKKNQE